MYIVCMYVFTECMYVFVLFACNERVTYRTGTCAPYSSLASLL
jgi:hypothetical protein